jgi:hypothetical protein
VECARAQRLLVEVKFGSGHPNDGTGLPGRPTTTRLLLHVRRLNGLLPHARQPSSNRAVLRPRSDQRILSHHGVLSAGPCSGQKCAPLTDSVTLSLCIHSLRVVDFRAYVDHQPLSRLPIERLRAAVRGPPIDRVSVLGKLLYRDDILVSHMRAESGTFFSARSSVVLPLVILVQL